MFENEKDNLNEKEKTLRPQERREARGLGGHEKRTL
jgi:hypothetical protein